MIENLLGIKWKIFTGIGVLVSLGLGVQVVLDKIEIRHLNKQAEVMTENLKFCQRETAALKVAIDQQNDAIQTKADELDKVRRIAGQQLAAAQEARRKAETSAAARLRNPPKGDTLEARVRDVDARIMETVK